MSKTEFNKKQVIKYLLWTFGIAWAMQIGVGVLAKKGIVSISQILMSLMMFAPLIGTLLSGYKLKGMGWKPKFKGNVKAILCAWFLPGILTALGAALYFLIFPSHLDLSGNSFAANYGEEVLQQMEAQGISFPMYILISIISAITYAPLINMFFAIGEEAGWRGFLYPQLKARFGNKLGPVLGGVIWGCWHWPVIWLIGYEYGTDYFGFPIVGMLAFCIITYALGVLHDWLYEKSKCIWVPALFHGSYNAAATVPLVITVTNIGSMRLLGPVPVGLLSALPIIIIAVVITLRSGSADSVQKEESSEESTEESTEDTDNSDVEE